MNNTIKKSIIRKIGIPESVESEAGLQEVFNGIINENLPTGNIRGVQIQEKRETPNTYDPERPPCCHASLN